MSDEKNDTLSFPEKNKCEENTEDSMLYLTPNVAQHGTGSKVLINSGKGEIINIENNCEEAEAKRIIKEKEEEIKILKDEIKVLKDEIKVLKKEDKKRIGF